LPRSVQHDAVPCTALCPASRARASHRSACVEVARARLSRRGKRPHGARLRALPATVSMFGGLGRVARRSGCDASQGALRPMGVRACASMMTRHGTEQGSASRSGRQPSDERASRPVTVVVTARCSRGHGIELSRPRHGALVGVARAEGDTAQSCAVPGARSREHGTLVWGARHRAVQGTASR
jgi:hypothetical protein